MNTLLLNQPLLIKRGESNSRFCAGKYVLILPGANFIYLLSGEAAPLGKHVFSKKLSNKLNLGKE
jgi:hypothetical protein